MGVVDADDEVVVREVDDDDVALGHAATACTSNRRLLRRDHRRVTPQATDGAPWGCGGLARATRTTDTPTGRRTEMKSPSIGHQSLAAVVYSFTNISSNAGRARQPVRESSYRRVAGAARAGHAVEQGWPHREGQ